MSKRVAIRVFGVAALTLLVYGIGLFQGRARLALVLQAADVASSMSGTWERSDTGAVQVLIRRYEHHAWYVLFGAYADPREVVEPPHILAPHNVVVVKNTKKDDSNYQRLEVIPGSILDAADAAR